MAEQRQPFRFRLPWLAPERPASQPQRRRPTTESQPPWRPGLTPPPRQPPPRASPSQPATKSTTTASKPTSPAPEIPKTSPSSQVSKPASSAAAEIPKTSPSTQVSKPSLSSPKPVSPSSPTAKIVKTDSDSASPLASSTTKGPSPSKSTSSPKSAPQQSPKQSFGTVKLDPLSRATGESPKVNPKSASPSAPARTQSKGAVSPSKGDSKSKTGSNSQAQPEPQKPPQPKEPSSSAQEEPKRAIPQEPLQELEPKAKLISLTTSGSKTGVSADQKPAAEELKETEEKKEITRKLYKEEESQKVIVEAASSEKEVRDVGIGDFNTTDKKQTQEAPARSETFSTTSYIGKQIKTGTPSQPIEGNTVTTSTEESAPRHREVKDEISKLVCQLATDAQSHENRVSIVTLTGDNKGATMLLSSDPAKKEARIHIHRGYKTDPDDSTGATTDGEAPNNGKIIHPQTTPQPKAYVNSNAQGLNNSIVVEASVSERNPGVHFFLTLNASEAVKDKTSSDSVQTRRAECTATSSERLTHESSVRRRCLRGLFMESSDSDKPDKPRRHGCRYSCGQKNKDREFM